MVPLSLYDVLGVPPTASHAQIVTAYRRAARRTHPDAGGSESAFRLVSMAYEVLGDTDRRRDYDRRIPLSPAGGVADRTADGVTSRAVRRRYLTMMAVCVTLFVLAGSVIRFVSVPAALAMMLVAAVIPPVAAIIANRSR
ncbi:hypothetical protein FDG2_5232 [Candidatus Protofrankia californiensis]|uniref:J domain-containing protein n=1 Tax=Candidatus Protofrankia californiensis TaxID=1839754 RepID=A0A1C3PBP7_9ACTN|nr:J domain-containing protein [Protofrankia symbiont of Coriaria ruscifolia]SBW27237.1 hypothetical protein FDG2_5232 [Candidatus Protofrankia californiensis]